MNGTGIRYPGQDGAAGRGFTLIELLVVIGIIGLLISITLVVGNTVMTGGKKTLTTDTLRILDHSLDAYIHANGENPAPLVAIDPTQPNVMFPAADARDMVNQSMTGVIPAGHQMINSLGVYLFQASQVPEAKAVLDTLPSKVVTTYNSDGAIVGQPKMMMVLDGWKHPIRYVHPAFQGTLCDKANSAAPQVMKARAMDDILGAATAPQTYSIAQVRRNHVATATPMAKAEDWPDSDGGVVQGTRPYFYSAGPDGLVGVSQAVDPATQNPLADYNTDNVYTTKPQLPGK